MSGILEFFSNAWNFISTLIVNIVTELRTIVDLFLVILDGQWLATLTAYVPAVFITSAFLCLVLIVLLRIFGRR